MLSESGRCTSAVVGPRYSLDSLEGGGGCVEGAVFEEAMQVIKSGTPRLLHYGIADEFAMDVGLACGGMIDVFVERLDW